MSLLAMLCAAASFSLIACGPPTSPEVVSKTGAIRAPHPQPGGADWTWKVLDREGDGFALEEIKWALGTPPTLMLYAKDYRSSDAATTCTTDPLAGLFASVTSPLSATPTTMLGHPACKLEGSGLIGDRPMSIVEYRFTVPGHQLILSAAGGPDRMSTLAGEIQSWFEGVQFAMLKTPAQ